jgi:cyclopropane-fatty-acyl-phospholipid synthase
MTTVAKGITPSPSRGVSERATEQFIGAMEAGALPDSVIRWGIRLACRARLARERRLDREARQESLTAFVERMSRSVIADRPDAANEQHYELPPEFFELVLGPHRKYSSARFDPGVESLAEAEVCALEQTIAHAELRNGQRILELGCGWGSLTLEMARRFPGSSITALSNSAPQRETIEARARAEGLSNVTVLTRDVNDGLPEGSFDRIVSVEMFEHVRNPLLLLEAIHERTSPQGKLFLHVFSHDGLPYFFEDAGASDWMSRTFFTGGIMPSDDLLLHYQRHFVLERRWRWSGRHYERTANAWLANLDERREGALEILREAYGADAELWLQRWRIFFMSCAELFGLDAGERWGVVHARFVRR